MNGFFSVYMKVFSLFSTLRILFSGAFCLLHLLLIYGQAIKQAVVFTNTILLPLLLSDTNLCFSKRSSGVLLLCNRKKNWRQWTNLVVKVESELLHMETRGNIWVSHVRGSYLHKDAITGMASYSRRILVGVNTVLYFFFNWKCATMCSEQ